MVISKLKHTNHENSSLHNDNINDNGFILSDRLHEGHPSNGLSPVLV